MIGALLRMPWESVRERMLAGLHARGFTDLSAAHLAVVQWPGPDDLRPSELAAQTHMSKQALNYLLGQLEQLGYLQRRDDPRDQRYKRIVLTERGLSAARAIRDIVQETENEWEHRLGSQRFTQLRLLLTDLNDHVTAHSTHAATEIRHRSAPPPDPGTSRTRASVKSSIAANATRDRSKPATAPRHDPPRSPRFDESVSIRDALLHDRGTLAKPG